MDLKASRNGVPPTVKLSDNYKFVDAMMTMVPEGPPSLIQCTKLTVDGTVVFAKGVVIKGEVKVTGNGKVEAGTYENTTVNL